MFCGTSSFRRRAAADPSAPKCSRSKSKSKSKSKNKNPYSSRGLEKFTSVLSELEARREKIMATTGAQGISMIRFMYSNSQDWIPIIVRLRDNNNSNNSNNSNNNNNNNNNNQGVPAAAGSPKKPDEVVSTSAPHPLPPQAVAVQRLPWWKWRPAYCMPLMMVFILLCLVIFGRVFAICCTSIWWYSVPILRGEEEGRTTKRVSRKKDYVKKISDKRLPAPAPAYGSG